MSALRSAPYGIGLRTTRGGATARASASTAVRGGARRRRAAAPPGSSTTNAVSPAKVVFCQEVAVPW